MVVLKTDLLRIPVRVRACVSVYLAASMRARVRAAIMWLRLRRTAAERPSALRAIMCCSVCVLSKRCSCEHRGYAAQALQADGLVMR